MALGVPPIDQVVGVRLLVWVSGECTGGFSYPVQAYWTIMGSSGSAVGKYSSSLEPNSAGGVSSLVRHWQTP